MRSAPQRRRGRGSHIPAHFLVLAHSNSGTDRHSPNVTLSSTMLGPSAQCVVNELSRRAESRRPRRLPKHPGAPEMRRVPDPASMGDRDSHARDRRALSPDRRRSASGWHQRAGRTAARAPRQPERPRDEDAARPPDGSRLQARTKARPERAADPQHGRASGRPVSTPGAKRRSRRRGRLEERTWVYGARGRAEPA